MHIKEICKEARIEEAIEKQHTKGGKKPVFVSEKWEFVRTYRQAFILYKHGEAWISDKSNNADFWSQERKYISKICYFDTHGICDTIKCPAYFSNWVNWRVKGIRMQQFYSPFIFFLHTSLFNFSFSILIVYS